MKQVKKTKKSAAESAAELAACEVYVAPVNQFAGLFNADANTEEYTSDRTGIQLKVGDIIRYSGAPFIVTRSAIAGAKIMPLKLRTEKFTTKLTGVEVEFSKRPTGHNISRMLGDRSWFIKRGGPEAIQDFLNGKQQPFTDQQPAAKQNERKNMKINTSNNARNLSPDAAEGAEVTSTNAYDSKPAPAVNLPKAKGGKKGAAKAATVKGAKAKKGAKPAKGKAAAKPAKKTDGATVVRSEQKEYIWSQLDGSKTKAEIVAAVVKKFGTDAETTAKRVSDAPFYMRKAGLKPSWKE